MEKPIGLEEHTVQYFVRNYSIPRVDVLIEKCKREDGLTSYLVREWEYIKWRIQQKQNVFVFR